jgi:hypothetical protein
MKNRCFECTELELPGFDAFYFCRQASSANYRVLTPREKKTEFRKQETEWIRNEGVRNG